MRFSPVGLLVLCILLIGLAMGQTPTPTAAPGASGPGVVFIPYDKLKGPALDDGQSVLIPYAEFLKLQAGMQTPVPGGESKPYAAVSDVVYTGEVIQEIAVLEAQVNVEVIAKEKEQLEIPAGFAGVAIESARMEGAAGTLAVAENGGLVLHVKGPGRRTIRLKMAVALGRSGAVRSLEFAGVRSAASSLTVKIPGRIIREEAAGSVPFTVTVEGETSVVKASGGSAEKLVLVYRPESKAGDSVAEARYTAEQQSTVRLGSKAVGAQVRYQFQVLAGAIESVELSIPEGVRILNVSGGYVKDWSEPDEKRLMRVNLLQKVGQPFDLTLETQLPEATGTGVYTVPEIRIPGARRETGMITVVPDLGVAFWPESTAGLESLPNVRSDVAANSRMYRYTQPGWRLALSQRPIVARVRAESLILNEITESDFRIKSRHQLTISDRGIFEVTLEAPEGFQVREAGPADVVAGFRQEGTRVQISLRGEQAAQLVLQLRFQRPRGANENTAVLRTVSVAGAEEDSGVLVLAAPLALRVTESSSKGLQARDVRSVQDQLTGLLGQELQPVLGYYYFSPAAEATVSIERQRPLLTCDTTNLVTIQPALLRVDATLSYSIEFSATDEFQVLVPSSVRDNVRFNGADIKEKTPATGAGVMMGDDVYTTWTLRLQRRMLGRYTLAVTFDKPLPASEVGKPTSVAVPLVIAGGVSREQGSLGVARGENMEVSVASADGLEPRDAKELPAQLAGASLGFRYFEPAKAALELDVMRHELESVLGALVRRMHIDTVLSDQGQAVHEVIFEVQNNREQYLELKLPKTMEIWSVFVAGAPVRSTTRQSDGARLIELARSQSRDDAFRVRIVLRESLPGGPLDYTGSLDFLAPEPLNMPVLRMTRRLYLPKDFRYVDFGGTMRRESGGQIPWTELAGEKLITDLPASVAGGIAQPNLRPPVANLPATYDSTETEAEKQARLGGAALEIPITREGSQFDFSMQSGVGTIEISFWKRKVLFIIQLAEGLLLFVALLLLAGLGKRPLVAVVAVLVTFSAASLTDGLAGRLLATAFAAAGASCAVVLVIAALRRARAAMRVTPRILHEVVVPDPVPVPFPASVVPPGPAEPPKESSEAEDTQPPAKS